MIFEYSIKIDYKILIILSNTAFSIGKKKRNNKKNINLPVTTSVLYRMDQKENNQIQISLKNQIQIKPLFATTVQRSTCVSHKLPNHHLYLTIQKKPHSIYKSLTRCLTYHKTWSVKNKVIKIKWTWMTLDKLNIIFFFF